MTHPDTTIPNLPPAPDAVAGKAATLRLGRSTVDFLTQVAAEVGVTFDQITSVVAALSARRYQQASPFQSRAIHWANQTFPPDVVHHRLERCDRALEEHIELLQSLGYPRERIPTLVEYVYNRPVGDPVQELGGVMVTLAVLASVVGLDMTECAERELARINKPEVQERVRQKQANKNGIHDPRPGVA